VAVPATVGDRGLDLITHLFHAAVLYLLAYEKKQIERKIKTRIELSDYLQRTPLTAFFILIKWTKTVIGETWREEA